MSAVEKLRALKPEGLVESVAPFEGYTDAVCLSIPAHAAVVAVVEALTMIADHGHEMDDYQMPPKQARKIARDALAQLSEALP